MWCSSGSVSGECLERGPWAGQALEQARESGDSIKDEIWREMAGAKYRQWEGLSTERRHDRRRLQARLEHALAALQRSEAHSSGEVRACTELSHGPGQNLPYRRDIRDSRNSWVCARKGPSLQDCKMARIQGERNEFLFSALHCRNDAPGGENVPLCIVSGGSSKIARPGSTILPENKDLS